MDQCLNLERAFFNPCKFFSDNRVTEELCSKGKLSNTEIHSKRGIRYLFLGKKMKNHGIIFAFQRQGILCQCILEKHRKKRQNLDFYPCHKYGQGPYELLKVIPDKDRE